jgi:hypothetical protein
MFLRRCLDPDCEAARQRLFIGPRFGDNAAAGSGHKVGMVLEHAVEHAALGPAIGGLVGESENLAE